MHTPRRFLPSTALLAAFEATARTGSMTLAARELRLTQSAVLRCDEQPELGAIQLTTAAGCVAMVELFLLGKLPAKGFVRQEDASLSDFLSTREGSRLAKEARSSETGDLAARLASKRAA